MSNHKQGEKTEDKIRSWMAENKERLPLASCFWEINSFGGTNTGPATVSIGLGRYDAAIFQSVPFYKSYSRMTTH